MSSTVTLRWRSSVLYSLFVVLCLCSYDSDGSLRSPIDPYVRLTYRPMNHVTRTQFCGYTVQFILFISTTFSLRPFDLFADVTKMTPSPTQNCLSIKANHPRTRDTDTLIMPPPTIVGGEHYVIRSFVSPSVCPSIHLSVNWHLFRVTRCLSVLSGEI